MISWVELIVVVPKSTPTTAPARFSACRSVPETSRFNRPSRLFKSSGPFKLTRPSGLPSRVNVNSKSSKLVGVSAHSSEASIPARLRNAPAACVTLSDNLPLTVWGTSSSDNPISKPPFKSDCSRLLAALERAPGDDCSRLMAEERVRFAVSPLRRLSRLILIFANSASSLPPSPRTFTRRTLAFRNESFFKSI